MKNAEGCLAFRIFGMVFSCVCVASLRKFRRLWSLRPIIYRLHPMLCLVFEFKLDGTASEALKQIDGKGYAEPYAADPRKLFKIVLVFRARRRILWSGKWLVKRGETWYESSGYEIQRRKEKCFAGFGCFGF